MNHFDAIIVGSGINSLVCAALMSRRGKKVLVLERERQLGGCIRTEMLVPGYLHDTLSTAHPLFVTSPGYATLKEALHQNGLEYVSNNTPTGVLLPDGRALVLSRDRAANVAAMNTIAAGDGDAYAEGMHFIEQHATLIFSLLGNELWSSGVGKTLARQLWKAGIQDTTAFFGTAMQPCRAWLETRFQSDLVRALLAPWVLHTGLGPESPMSSLMAQVIAFTLEAVGLPLVKGGNRQTVDAFQRVIEAAGGTFRTECDVSQILVENKTACGVRLHSGEVFHARHVICNVTPTQLYGRLLPAENIPPSVRQQAQAYRYGKGNMQIHLSLSAPPHWASPQLRDVTYLHLTGGLDSVSRAVNEAECGLLPAEGTICIAQPCALDPTRAPAGGWILWIQLPECPRRIKGDAAGIIAPPEDGGWTPAISEQYADRIIERIRTHLPDLLDLIVGRTVISPDDLEKMNINLVGGDPYSGECAIDQYLFWRPLRGTRNHQTPVRNLYHIGASTHPGPGLSGASGFHVGHALASRR